MHSPSVRIVIADDHPLLREGLRKLLSSEPSFSIVGEAADGVAALQLATEHRPDLLLLDVVMPRLTGMDVLRELATAKVEVRTILLTAEIEKAQIIEALKLGARGIVLKDAAAALIVKSIHTVLAGQYWVGREGVSELVRVLQELMSSNRNGEKPAFNLTPRELEVIGTVVGGYTNKEIASRFFLSEQTIKHHLTNIFDKLGVSNRVELALFAVHHRLVSN